MTLSKPFPSKGSWCGLKNAQVLEALIVCDFAQREESVDLAAAIQAWFLAGFFSDHPSAAGTDWAQQGLPNAMLSSRPRGYFACKFTVNQPVLPLNPTREIQA